MIIFVLVMNLADEYIKVKIPKAVQYYKGDFPVPLMELYMDDACLLTALTYDMNNVLVFISKFVDWSRFNLKATKSRALVFKLGKEVNWFLDNVEGTSGNAIVVDDVESTGGEDMVDGEVVVDEMIYVGAMKLYLMFVRSQLSLWVAGYVKMLRTHLSPVTFRKILLVIWRGWTRASLVIFRSVGAINLWFSLR